MTTQPWKHIDTMGEPERRARFAERMQSAREEIAAAEGSGAAVLPEHTITVEKPVIQYRDRVVVRTVTKPDGTKVETRVDDKTSKTTGEKVVTSDARVTRQETQRVEPAPEGRWSVRALASVDSRGSVGAGAGFDYRLVGPLTVGAWITAPVAGVPGPFVAGVSLGLRLP